MIRDAFISMFVYPVIAIWGVFILLLIFMPRKRRIFIEKEKKYAVIIPLLLIGSAAWFTFFEDAEFRFVCRKETQHCDYYHSTLFNKELRIADSYSLDGINDTAVKKRKRPRGGRRRGVTKTVYTLVFNGPEKHFEMPKDFHFWEDALEQAEKAGVFLHTDVPEYVYTETSDPVNGIIFFFMIILGSSGMMGCFTLLSKMNEKESDK